MTLSPNESFSPEKVLLVYCARPEIEPIVAEQIRARLQGKIDWDLLLQSAAEHSVTPLLSQRICSIAYNLIDPARINHFKDLPRSIAIRNLVLVAELVKIMERLGAEGIQAIPYKGPVLAMQAYGDVALREFEDLDIVLRQRDVAKSHQVMTSLGYQPKIPGLFSGAVDSIVPAEYMYIRSDGAHRTLVELHTERTLRHFPQPPDLDDLASRLVPVSIGGHELRTFSPEDTLILLCIHGSKHFWERLSWIADIAALVQRHPDLDWDSVRRRASALHATRMINISLSLAVDLFDLPLPSETISQVKLESAADSIASRIESGLLASRPQELSAIARFHRRRHLIVGVAEGWRYATRLALLPSDDDWDAMRLPASLSLLYPVLRPFRLLRKYGIARADSTGESFAGKRASN